MRDVVRSASFTHLGARLHNKLPHNSPLRRTFHVYGRHSSSASTPKNQEVLSLPNTHRFQKNPFQVCFAIRLGITPTTTCDLDLFSLVHNKTVSLPVVKTSRSSSNDSVYPAANTSGNLSLSLAVRAFGSYSKTTDLLKFKFIYSGNVSVSYMCPEGCELKPTSDIAYILNYHKLLKTPETQIPLPLFPGFRLNSDINVTWTAALRAQSANLTSLTFQQPFSIAVIAGYETESDRTQEPVKLNVTMPTPMTGKNEILLRSVAEPDPKTGSTMYGSGPSGAVALKTKITTKFRDSGTVIEGILNYNHGVKIDTAGNDDEIFGPVLEGRSSDHLCHTYHRRRVTLEPYFVNITGYTRSTDSMQGFNNTDFNIEKAVVGKPLTACLGPLH